MIQDQYDLIVVGSGFCGSVIARLAAEQCHKKVLVLEKREHIAGNMYDYFVNDFLVQKYGPHVFHTNDDKVFKFISKFELWDNYKLHYGVDLNGKCIPAPFGFKAIRLLYSQDEAEQLINSLKSVYVGRDSVSILELVQSTDKRISDFANFLYENNYRLYAAKQWNLSPKELDPSVIGRMPVILSDREYYFTDKYEALPKHGFTHFFYSLLKHQGIDIKLGMDATQCFKFDFNAGTCWFKDEKVTIPIVYTGPLEDLCANQYTLPYRSLYFEYKIFDEKSFQDVALLTYPQRYGYLRTTEYSKLTGKGDNITTLVAFEYPIPYDKHAPKGNEPYYPILTEENIKKHRYYVKQMKVFNNFYPCGRLADYKYYNMDQAVLRGFEVFEHLYNKYWND